MGNCNKRDQALTVTNFDDDKWSTISTSIFPLCFILKNYYHPNVKLFKWISSSSKQNKISQWRLSKKSEYLVNIYEAGETRVSQDFNKQLRVPNAEKRTYIVTEQLIRLKDLTLTEDQAVIVAYRSLCAYKDIIDSLGGFIARENMIYISREGVVKVWIHENLANNEFQFHHPAITEEQFISSLLHQIFTRSVMQETHIYEYIKAGSISFNEVIGKLSYYIRKKQLLTFIDLSKEVFDSIIDQYQMKSAKGGKRSQSRQRAQENMNKLKFLVADDSPGADGRVVKDFVKDYSQKIKTEPTTSQALNREGVAHPMGSQGMVHFQHSNHSFIAVSDNFCI